MGEPGGGQQPSSLLGKQSQSGNIRFTVGQYWLIIKINGTNSVKIILWECVIFTLYKQSKNNT
jgi:hypothetical protein